MALTSAANRFKRLLGLLVMLTLGTALAAACASAPEPGAAASSAAVKMVVDSDGAYEVSAGVLQKAGFDLAGANPEQLTLTAGGHSVPFLLAGQARARSLRFYGQGLAPSSYDGRNIYRLSEQEPSQSSSPLSACRGAAAVSVSGGGR
jgi:hypothetical protein